ncbi:hypothetical protein EFT87_14450 [Schleiferilactobacillus harbinensis]|uniref:hypothetical protein n=1 Tax=Schleiferilactobacillus harbinensis TaxID=304207 RepID=UPI0021A33E7C|nr:hypothetical protein [Schleiferilactobacillus harbinensis]MCT2909840.1 hypothetical protein [Schleiferilactobacillus harbinensis]
MNKQEAKKEFSRWFNPKGFQNRDLIVYEVKYLIDSIEPEHKKVALPKIVGEQWDMLVDHYVSCQKVTDKSSAINYAMRWLPNRWSVGLDCGDLLYWWANTQDSYTKLADAARYGWVAKPEKLYRVKVYGIDLPGLYYRKREDGTLTFVQGGAGMPETEFTISEIEQLHLENCERVEINMEDSNVN